MSTEATIYERIERAATRVGAAWPLHSFVTANPLAGFEDRPFADAVREGRRLFGGTGYPDADTFRRAWERDRIDPETLSNVLADHGYDEPPEELLARMERQESTADGSGAVTAEARVERVLTKWLAAFFDQGRADWPMPNRERGFYNAVRSLAPYDGDLRDRSAVADLPDDPVDAIRTVLGDQPPGRWEAVFEYHLTALPGWTGFIKRRIEDGNDWQSDHPVTLAGYLAVRLVLADLFDAPVVPPSSDGRDRETGDETTARGAGDETTARAADDTPLPELWLEAWEATYRGELVGALTDAGATDTTDTGTETDTAGGTGRGAAAGSTTTDGRPATQLVFCIDTRSEIIRRHVEQSGPYETHGYAGFFGVPMRYAGYDADVSVDACPPILDAEHRIEDRPVEEREDARAAYDRWVALRRAASDLLHRLKTNPGTAFSFVESAGLGYGLALAARTLLPARVRDGLRGVEDRSPDVAEFCRPVVDHEPEAAGELPTGLTLDERVEYAASVFELMGWAEFGRLVVFVGHASRTTNNPFDSSLDCGACAGNPGGPSARVLAAICNDDVVRNALRGRGIDIPEDTVFLAGEHNTTTDEVRLYDDGVPESHAGDIERLRDDLETARAGAAGERAADMDADPASGVRETERRAADWAEPRPEWGLAGNAAFVVGPRELTAGLDLDGRTFLHSYDPASDPDGAALEAIMTGPMVVTQWINSQYYFATVDNDVYGSGSKVTGNPVGNVGVYQGNGGDLRTGLPLQSLYAADGVPYHQPLRLSVVVDAPVERVTDVLAGHDHLTDLLDNGWLSLTVVDPEQGHDAFRYDGDLTWAAEEDGGSTGVETVTERARSVAED